MTVNRGEVWMIKTPFGEKPHLIVSNQQRNRALNTILCARVTTSPKRPSLPSIIPLTDHDGSVVGRVLCDELFTVPKDQLTRRISNGLPPRLMDQICLGLRSALACL